MVHNSIEKEFYYVTLLCGLLVIVCAAMKFIARNFREDKYNMTVLCASKEFMGTKFVYALKVRVVKSIRALMMYIYMLHNGHIIRESKCRELFWCNFRFLYVYL